MDPGILTPWQVDELTTIRDDLKPCGNHRGTNRIQNQVIDHARLKTHAQRAN